MMRVFGSWAWASTFALFACQVTAQTEPKSAATAMATQAPAKDKDSGKAKAKPPASGGNKSASPGSTDKAGKDSKQEKSGDKPAAKPGDKPAAKPGDKPAAKPDDKPAAKPDDKPAAKPDDKGDEDPNGATETPKPAEKPKPSFGPARASLGKLEFNGGEVELIERMLKKTRKRVGACVDDHGGLSKSQGLIKLQFLVRSRGRAEGVEVLKFTAVTQKAARCVRKVMKNRWVGTPSNDPVGVVFTYRFAAAKSSK